ncbi:MAG: protein kinase [Candidatus Obscuribacterales bacterium]
MAGDSEKLRKSESGDVIAGRYVIRKPLGEGGMGAVFQAMDRKLDKIVAVKTLLSTSMTDEDYIRFQREARVASNIDHPNVVKIYDFGVDEDSSQPYLVMEYLTGETLRTWLHENRPDSVLILSIVEQIAAGMAAVHKAGIVHRDLKSSNVIIATNEQGEPLARLLDFGAARAFRGESQTLTLDGMIVGTPRYLSPEQAQGLEVDERSDIYSLGCIGYELFSGRPPFEGETAMDTISMHISEEAPTFAELGIRLSSAFDREIEALIRKMIAKDPDARVQSMEELIREIARIRHSEVENVVPAERKGSPSKIALQAGFIVILLVVPVLLFLEARTRTSSSSGSASKSEAAKTVKDENKSEAFASHSFEEHILTDSGAQRKAQSFLYINPEESEILEECAKSDMKIPIFMADNVKLSDRDLDNLVKLEPTWLLLSRTGLGDAQLDKLSRCPSIETLKFYSNPDMTRAGLESLATLPRLESLSVRACNIDDQSLDEIKEMKGLNSLDLEYNPKITSRGLMKLAGLPELKVVAVYDTGVKLGSAGIEKLRRRLHLQKLYTETTFSSPDALASIDLYRKRTMPGFGTGPLQVDLRNTYDAGGR